MERAEAHLPSYAFFCWWCIHLGCKISFDVSCADDMTGKQAGIELCAVPFFRRAFQVYDTLNTAQGLSLQTAGLIQHFPPTANAKFMALPPKMDTPPIRKHRSHIVL